MAKKQSKDSLAKEGLVAKTKVIQSKPKTKGKAIKSETWGDEYLKKYILRCKKEADSASTERRSAWRELWFLYQNKQSTKNKKGWQSKCFAPKIWMKVERAAATVKRALLQTNKLFKLDLDELEGETEEDITKIEMEMKRIEKRFKRALSKTNYVNKYAEMTKCLFLLGLGVLKVLWHGPKQKATFENVDILNVWVDPNYEPFGEESPKYIIESKEMDLAELRLMAKETNEAAEEPPFNTTEINKIEEDFKRQEKDGLRQQRMGLTQHGEPSKRVAILEFWGDVISEDGYEVKKKQVMMLANDKYMIRKQDNPFDHGKPPYVLNYAMVYPHRGMAGVSLVEASAKLQYTYNNILNLYMDNLNFSVNKMFEYAPLALKNPKEMLSIYPGKMFEKQSAEGQAVREIATSNIGPEAISAMETVGREIQEATAVTEFLQGMPGKKTKTLGEVQIKTAESQGLFDIVARDLEGNSIKPILELTYSLYAQFGDDLPDIEDIFVFVVGGLSLQLLQKEQVEQIGQTLGMALQFPELHAKTDIDDLWKKLLSINNLSDVYIEQDQQRQELTPEQVAQIKEQAQENAHAKVANASPQEMMTMAG